MSEQFEVVKNLRGSEVVMLRVDVAKRRIAGMAVEWDRPHWCMGRRFLFERGSLAWTKLDRVKFNLDHNRSDTVGMTVEAETGSLGLNTVFQVADVPEGDRALTLAKDRAWDGLSIEALIQRSSRDSDEDGPYVRVHRAELQAVALTPHPSSDNARVLAVFSKADPSNDREVPGTLTAHDPSRSSGKAGSMSENDGREGQGDGGQGGEPTPTILTNQDAAMTRFRAEMAQRFEGFTDQVRQSVADSVAESAAASGEQIAVAVSNAVTAAFSRLQDVDATGRGTEAAARIKVISEPPIYRFDGDVTAPSLVKDAWNFHMDGDFDARDRLRKFQAQQSDIVKLATVTTGTAGSVIPPGYRPELYVTQLMQGRPIVSTSSRGTISDATPFKVPRFVSATGATADHVQGVNPTDGTLNVSDVTVTPGAISGMFRPTREIVDASNPAIDAIAMQAMRESWNQQTEQKAYAKLNLNANIGTSVDTSVGGITGATPQEAINDARDILATYPFTRFASPTGAVIGQAVTRAFANAKDTTGRPLLPSVGAQNAAGIGNAVSQGWFVDGLAFVPAWAMTQAVGDELALIVNREDWWTWESPLLTFRFEEKSGPAHIELALFGYYATEVLRPAGIASLRAVV